MESSEKPTFTKATKKKMCFLKCHIIYTYTGTCAYKYLHAHINMCTLYKVDVRNQAKILKIRKNVY